ncbi:uridine kinase [Aspergillus niger]|uniref:Uridine kinase n=1 Tax=Aspergillus niger TaxID=5061 RepID=A0A254UGD1_ASPNG|nr:hypothetical protein CBS133816_10007 [Aspergillus niger]KAI2941497.1 hypothetical protein CBS147322_9366 [Aspergillus niger]KAI2996650.1 hypothetical protein CBS147345_9590 [Aspergillus niger]TPR04934.1 uridine kinase [Aspergillus niger]SPB51783.1 unnamed protein product [Aspergillus niger]
MSVVTAQGVAIAELIVYIPISLVTLFVVLRHGFHRQLGWIYLFIFSGVRIAGAVMEILSETHPDNTTDLEWAIILQSVGLSPLLLSSLGLLKRVSDEICDHAPSTQGSRVTMVLQKLSSFSSVAAKLKGFYNKKETAISGRSKVVQLLHIPALIALILSIIGGLDQYSSDTSEHSGGKTETRVGIILFLAIYIVLCILWSTTVKDLPRMAPSQKRIVGVVLIALPLIACRLLYSLVADFSHDRRFSLVDGNVTIRLCMAIIEEFLVVLMYTVLGVFTPRSEVAVNSTVSNPQKWPSQAKNPRFHTSPLDPRNAHNNGQYEPV